MNASNSFEYPETPPLIVSAEVDPSLWHEVRPTHYETLPTYDELVLTARIAALESALNAILLMLPGNSAAWLVANRALAKQATP